MNSTDLLALVGTQDGGIIAGTRIIGSFRNLRFFVFAYLLHFSIINVANVCNFSVVH